MSCSKDDSVAVISTEFGDMVVEFYPDVAPMHVESFTILANEGYFDGTTFHRLIPGFVIQGGDPNSKDDDRMNNGTGGRAGKYFGIGRKNEPDTWLIPQEFNDKLHVRGTLSMARSPIGPNSASSQFFICHNATPQLDKQYRQQLGRLLYQYPRSNTTLCLIRSYPIVVYSHSPRGPAYAPKRDLTKATRRRIRAVYFK